jgi:hypothetical protein
MKWANTALAATLSTKKPIKASPASKSRVEEIMFNRFVHCRLY